MSCVTRGEEPDWTDVAAKLRDENLAIRKMLDSASIPAASTLAERVGKLVEENRLRREALSAIAKVYPWETTYDDIELKRKVVEAIAG